MKNDMIMKRLLALLLSAILAATCFSCAAKTEEETETETSSIPVSVENSPETAETSPVEEERIAGPATVDLGGYSFRILTSYWYNNDKIILPEELTGEVINDAVYNANLNTMNTYNFVFTPIILNEYPQVTPAVTSSVKAGMDEYDMTLNHDNQTVSSALSGNHLNIRASDIFNFDAPWWTRTADDFTVGGGMYFAANYTTYSPLYFGFALVYNKSLAEDYHIEIPYDKIIAGEWYLEDLISMTKDVNRDLNGDGKMEVGVDQYGFMASTLGLVNFQVSLGNFMLDKDEEGYLVLNVDEERLSRTLEAVERLMENGVNKDDDPTIPWGYGTSFFAQGQVLFNYPQIVDIPAQMHDTDTCTERSRRRSSTRPRRTTFPVPSTYTGRSQRRRTKTSTPLPPSSRAWRTIASMMFYPPRMKRRFRSASPIPRTTRARLRSSATPCVSISDMPSMRRSLG